MGKKITIKRTPDKKLTLNFYYDYHFIEKLKGAVPAGDRDYDPENDHTWTINDLKYEAAVLELARQHFEVAVMEFKDDNNDLVTLNLKTGEETRMASLF